MTLTEFFNRLEDALFPHTRKDQLPSEWLAFRRQTEAREEIGREIFGDEYLRRNNAEEGLEEACDGALYSVLEVARTEQQGGDVDEAAQLALIAAHHFYEGYEALHRLQTKTPALPISEPSTS